MTDATAIYQPLDTSKHEFRLICVSADEDGKISILLDVFSLDSPPEYLALSYCWTEHPPTIQITLNGLPFWIRPNLHDFLQRFSGERKTDWIYIDALCIDQASVAERSSQVNVMGRIYRGARKVIAWLGGRLPDDPIISAHHEEIEHALSALHSASFLGQDVEALTSQPFQAGQTQRMKPIYGTLLTAFSSHTYWKRLWIFQELVLAQDFSIWCGRLHLTLYELSAMIQLESRLLPEMKKNCPGQDQLPYNYTYAPAYAGIMKRRGQYLTMVFVLLWRQVNPLNDFQRHSYGLMFAINSTANLDCSLVHDHIFSIMGLTSSMIVADYTTPILELYLRTLAEVLLDLSRGPPAPEAPPGVFRDPLYYFWANLLLSVRLSHLDPLVALTTAELSFHLGLLTVEPKNFQELKGLNALEQSLYLFTNDHHFSLGLVCEIQRPKPKASSLVETFARWRADVKIGILIGRLGRKVKKDANLTEAGEGGRTMPCSAWINLSRRIAREAIEAKNRQIEERVARSKTDVAEEAEKPERPAARDTCWRLA